MTDNKLTWHLLTLNDPRKIKHVIALGILKEPYKSEAIYNVLYCEENTALDKSYYSDAQNAINSFIWRKTKEGEKYWSHIYYNIITYTKNDTE